MAQTRQLDALLSLLDDPDPFIQESVRERLLDYGADVAPTLRRLVSTHGEPFAVARGGEILNAIGIREFRQGFARLLEASGEEEDIDLEEGAFLIPLLRYPEMRAESYRQQLDVMAGMLEPRLEGMADGPMLIREVNRYLIDELGFVGSSQEEYYQPENSFMNCVLDRRIGIPVTLSVVYLAIAQRLSIPLYGTNFPARFLMVYRTGSASYFIDAFGGGALLDLADCRAFLRNLGIEFQPQFFEPASNRVIVARMMRNVAAIYEREEPELAAVLNEAIETLLD